MEQGVPLFLSQLSDALKEVAIDRPDKSVVPSPQGTPAIATSAAEHGLALLKFGFTIEQVVHDYGDVCQAITQLSEERGANLSIVEFQTLNRCLDNAIAGAVASWSEGRERNMKTEDGVGRKESNASKPNLVRLLDRANAALDVLRKGTVGVSGATGEMLRRTLLELRSAVDKIR
jgi:hypothetical protein